MESLNLNTLASSLPTPYHNAEKELANNFRAAALSITTLYRSSRQNSKRAYNAGYAAACQDLLTMIQQGVSLDPSGSLDAEGGGMTIGRVMDWTEARLEAIRSREEEEEEDEEREKEKERGRPPAGNPVTAPKPEDKIYSTPEASSSMSPPKDRSVSLPTPNSPHSQPSAQFPCEPSSPSPPQVTAVRTIQRPIAKSRTTTKGDLAITHTTSAPPSIDYVTDNLSSNTSYPEVSIPITVGSKRRHGLMMMLDASSPPVGSPDSSSSGGLSTGGAHHGSGGFTTRRRTRSSKSLALQQSQNQNIIQPVSEAMDVEEEGGRERKRIARR